MTQALLNININYIVEKHNYQIECESVCIENCGFCVYFLGLLCSHVADGRPAFE